VTLLAMVILIAVRRRTQPLPIEGGEDDNVDPQIGADNNDAFYECFQQPSKVWTQTSPQIKNPLYDVVDTGIHSVSVCKQDFPASL